MNLADAITLVIGGLDEDEMSDAPSITVRTSLPRRSIPNLAM